MAMQNIYNNVITLKATSDLTMGLLKPFALTREMVSLRDSNASCVLKLFVRSIAPDVSLDVLSALAC